MILRQWLKLRSFSKVLQHCASPACRYQSTAISPNPTIPPALLQKARTVAAEHAHLSKRLDDQYDTQSARKAGTLANVATALLRWESTNDSVPGLQQIIKDSSEDEELRALAAEELSSVTEKLGELSRDLQTSLIPEHPFAHLPCLIEIRPGAGGDEAGLFAGDLLRMYQSYCKRHGLRMSLLKLESGASIGAEDQVQEAVLEIETPGAYDKLRCEAGVHRVQRIPATESKGRTHTSAVSVIVLPNFPSKGEDELGESNFDDPTSDYYVDPKDVRTDTMRAKGAGGQHVNTTDSAVRLTHLPTNTVVSMQDQRSQPQNRQKAWQVLRARLAQARREAREEEMQQLRVSVAGVSKTGRGDKVRTYNWGQQRVTDHRSGITVHDLDGALEGGDSLDKIMTSVKEWLKMKDIESLIADEEAVTVKA